MSSAAPRYFAKEIPLVVSCRTASAFGQVQGALSYLVDAYTNIASWRAVTDRLTGFNESIQNAIANATARCRFRAHGPPRRNARGSPAHHPPAGWKNIARKYRSEDSAGDTLLITRALRHRQKHVAAHACRALAVCRRQAHLAGECAHAVCAAKVLPAVGHTRSSVVLSGVQPMAGRHSCDRCSPSSS